MPVRRSRRETDQLSLPLGIGFDTLVKVGKVLTKVGVEMYYYVEQDDDYSNQQYSRVIFGSLNEDKTA